MDELINLVDNFYRNFLNGRFDFKHFVVSFGLALLDSEKLDSVSPDVLYCMKRIWLLLYKFCLKGGVL